jgi:hypothetical protein
MSTSLGPLGSSSSQHRRTRELICRKAMLPFGAHQPPRCRGSQQKPAKGCPHRACDSVSTSISGQSAHQDYTSRLKTHCIPSLSSQELQPRIPRMSNHTHVEVSSDVRIRWVCTGLPQCTLSARGWDVSCAHSPRTANQTTIREKGGCVEVCSLMYGSQQRQEKSQRQR